MSNVLASPNTGLQPDTWYSVQSYATDYYIAVGNSSTISQLSSNTDDSSLWQFLPGTSTGSYAIRSKQSAGRYCLSPGPALQACGSTAAQYRVFNAVSDNGADILVPSLTSEDAALHVSGDSSQGDPVETADLVNDVEFLFAISSVSAVDPSAYPTTLPSSSPTSTTSSAGNSTTLTTSTSQPTSSPTESSSSSSSASQSLSSSPAPEDTSSATPAPTSDAAPSTASSTVVVTEDAPVTNAASPTTSTVLIDPATTGSSTAASMSASPSIELSTGAGVASAARMGFVGVAVLGAGVWLL